MTAFYVPFPTAEKSAGRTGLALISQYYCSDNESRKLSGLLRLVAVNVRRSFPYDAKTDHDDQQAAQQASQHHRDSYDTMLRSYSKVADVQEDRETDLLSFFILRIRICNTTNCL